MRFHRKLLLNVFGLLICAAAAHATHLAPFIDLQEQNLNMSHSGKGLMNWTGGPETLTVNIAGPVRFALLYWAGRERPCTLDVSGTNCPFTQPYKDQVMNFNGTPITGTVIGTETQPATGDGTGPAIFNIGYYADVTAIVSAAGTGTQAFTFSDGNGASNLWRLDGVGLLVGYRDPRGRPVPIAFIVWDGLDFAFGTDPTAGETRGTNPVVFNHGVNFANRVADLLLMAGDGDADRPDNTTISNNATQFNILNAIEGPQFNTTFLPRSTSPPGSAPPRCR